MALNVINRSNIFDNNTLHHVHSRIAYLLCNVIHSNLTYRQQNKEQFHVNLNLYCFMFNDTTSTHGSLFMDN